MFDLFTETGTVSDGLNNGFFGSVTSGADQIWTDFSSALGKDILPNWANRQLGMQSTDQLRQPTFNAQAAAPNLNTTESAFDLKENQINVGAGGLMIIGVLFILTIVAIKKL